MLDKLKDAALAALIHLVSHRGPLKDVFAALEELKEEVDDRYVAMREDLGLEEDE